MRPPATSAGRAGADQALKSVFHDGSSNRITGHAAERGLKLLLWMPSDRPLHPSDCLEVPEPVCGRKSADAAAVTPLELLIALTAPFGLTRAADALADDPARGHHHSVSAAAGAGGTDMSTTDAPSKLPAPLLRERRGAALSPRVAAPRGFPIRLRGGSTRTGE